MYLMQIKNGDSVELKSNKVKRIWTILDSNFKIGDEPKHTVNAFLEDKWHDYYMVGNILHTTFHSSGLGELHTLLIIEE